MDRRYYLAKLAIVVVAIGLAFAGSGMDRGHGVHAVGAQHVHSAPTQVQQAAWHVANSAVHLIVCTATHALRTVAEIPH